MKKLLRKIYNHTLYGSNARNLILKNVKKDFTICEIGVWKGDFSHQLLNTQLKKMFLIDPYQYVAKYEGAMYGGPKLSQHLMDDVFRSVQERYKIEIGNGKVEMIRASSQEALAAFDDGFFDLVYIDGDHTYEAVLKDLELALTKIKSGGYLSGDDYGIVGWWKDGVKKAVDEFIINNRNRIQKVKIYNSQFLIKLK